MSNYALAQSFSSTSQQDCHFRPSWRTICSPSVRDGIFDWVHSSSIRQCLQQLTNEELEELLASSSSLCGAVREAASKPKGQRVDARMFRRWVGMPTASDPLLQELPARYAAEIRRRERDGEAVPRTTGVQALLLLSGDAMTVDRFKATLTDLRAAAVAGDQAPGVGTEQSVAAVDLSDVTAAIGSDDLRVSIDRLREKAGQVAEWLCASADEVRAGRPVVGVDETVASWNTAVHTVWEKLGRADVPTEATFSTLEGLRDRLAAEEREMDRIRQQERDSAQREALLEQLRASLSALEPLIGDPDFRSAYERAAQQIAELESACETARVDPDPEPDDADSVPNGSATESNGSDQAGAIRARCDEVDHDNAVVDSTPVEGLSEQATELTTPMGDGAQVAAAATVAQRADSEPVTASAPHDVDGAGSFVFLPADDETHQPTRSDCGEVAGDEHGVPDYHADDLAHHVFAGNFGAAWLVAQAADLPESDIQAYRFAASAFHSATTGIDPAEVLIGLTTVLGGRDFATPQSARTALAATLRAGLAAGWIPRSELEGIARQANLDVVWRHLVDAAVAAGDRNYQHLQDLAARRELSIDEVAERARNLRSELEGQRIKFARADKVRKYLLGPAQPVGAALDAILTSRSADERRLVLTDALTRLDSADDVIRDADQAVSTPTQLRRPIESHARNRLRKIVESVFECATEALNAVVAVAADSRVAVAQKVRHDLVDAAKAARTEVDAGAPGDVALARLTDWIIAPQPPVRAASDIQVLIEESLPVVCAERDDSGLPIITPENRNQVVEELRTPASPQELFDIYISRGDLQEAAAVARQVPQLQDRLSGERTAWMRRLRREVDAVRAELGRTYADDFNQSERAVAEAELVVPAQYTGDRFDLQMRALRAMSKGLERRRAETAKNLRRRVHDEVPDVDDRDRINALIDESDFVGANELLALARSGSLPARQAEDAPVGAHVFETFVEALNSLSHLASGATIRDVVGAIGGDHTERGVPIGHGDLDRLAHWENLIQKGHGGRAHRQATLGSILRALGLDTRGEVTRDPNPGVRHFDRYRVTATPVDGSLVPGLGSRATHYMVVATADHKLLRETLSKGFPTKSGPNIVLFAGVLTLEQRRQCLNTCRDQKISAVVVDYAVAAFVAARYPRSFRAVQQLTLPFTCFTHYTVVAGNVPDEVFVGRADEIATLTDPAGSLFVYGGRQLGKSALLRKIQRDFNSEPDHRAIFIDLNSHGIGTWADSQRLWPVLYNELARTGGMDVKANPAVRNSEPVVRAIQQWLAGKESRRLLLLLDEADAFLEKESSGARRSFENVGPLKGLFDDTQGRFKPVFAGLHKVQRLQNVANTPLAHGGRDVLIGPLAAKPASELVKKPLEALGYRFGNPEAVWRLLAFTNLQPGLIQVVCNDLVAHLQSRPLHKGEPLITISDADIDAVTQDVRTRDKIAEKLRLTIALEDRYRVIALAVAIMCMEDEFKEKYTAADIREHCEVYWQQGFEDLNSAEFEVYMDELVGLGVLIKDRDGRFSVRSPNIVTMLGTKEQLEIELDENKEQFELPHEYNPRSTRRQVAASDTTVRSPLSEHDLSRLVPVKSKYEAANFTVIGSLALGIEHVWRVLKSVGEERAIDVTVLDASTDDALPALSRFKFAGGGSSAPRLFVVDAAMLLRQAALDLARGVHSLRKRGHGHLVVVFGAAGLDAARELVSAPDGIQTTAIHLDKWSGDGIRSWHDNPFNTPGDRRELLTHSGGWPELVERAVADVSNRGISHGEEWERLSNFPEHEEAAKRFLESVGVTDHIRNILMPWIELGSASFERIADIAAVLDREVDEMRSLAADLAALGVLNERHEEYAIDPVVARALGRLV